MPRLPRPAHGWDIRDEDPDLYDATGEFAPNRGEPRQEPDLAADTVAGMAADESVVAHRRPRLRDVAAPVGIGLAAAALTITLGFARPQARAHQPPSPPRSAPAPRTPQAAMPAAAVMEPATGQAPEPRPHVRERRARRRPARRVARPGRRLAPPGGAVTSPPQAAAPRVTARPSSTRDQEFVLGAR